MYDLKVRNYESYPSEDCLPSEQHAQVVLLALVFLKHVLKYITSYVLMSESQRLNIPIYSK